MSLSERDENDIWKRLRDGEAERGRMDERVKALGEFYNEIKADSKKDHKEIRDDMRGVRRVMWGGIVTFVAGIAVVIVAKVI